MVDGGTGRDWGRIRLESLLRYQNDNKGYVKSDLFQPTLNHRSAVSRAWFDVRPFSTKSCGTCIGTEGII